MIFFDRCNVRTVSSVSQSHRPVLYKPSTLFSCLECMKRKRDKNVTMGGKRAKIGPMMWQAGDSCAKFFRLRCHDQQQNTTHLRVDPPLIRNIKKRCRSLQCSATTYLRFSWGSSKVSWYEKRGPTRLTTTKLLREFDRLTVFTLTVF